MATSLPRRLTASPQVEHLIAHGASTTQRDRNGTTPALLAAKAHNADILHALLKARQQQAAADAGVGGGVATTEATDSADVKDGSAAKTAAATTAATTAALDDVDDVGRNTLHYALGERKVAPDTKLLPWLLEHGANVNAAQSGKLWQPLHLACMATHSKSAARRRKRVGPPARPWRCAWRDCVH